MNRTFHRWLRCIGLIVLLWVLACPLFAQLSISVAYGPPALPVYEQPVCPAEGYMWTPGYWAWDPDYGYYWVPGTWISAPQTGYLWTPPWWGWNNGSYIFHEGYWGTQVGFYGGINYGFGYYGNGFEGGRWQDSRFFYNRSVMNVNVTEIHNVYNTRIVNRGVDSRVSYNGGTGGLTARPTATEREMERGRHLSPVAAQLQHRQQARGNPELRASANRGKPSIAATARPGSFSGHGVVAAREAGGSYHAPPSAKGTQPHEKAVENHPGGTPKGSKPAPTAERRQEVNPREARPAATQSRGSSTTATDRRPVPVNHNEKAVESHPGGTPRGSKAASTAERRQEANPREARPAATQPRGSATTATDRRPVPVNHNEKAVENHPGGTPRGSKAASTAERRQEANPREARPAATQPRGSSTTAMDRRPVPANHTSATKPREEHSTSAAAEKRAASGPVHASELSRHQAPATRSDSTAQEQKVHEQQQKLAAKQNQEHQTLARQQEREDQRAKQQNVQEKQRQQNEVRHQQQTQQMEQRHATETKHATNRPAPAKPATHESENHTKTPTHTAKSEVR